MLSSRRRTKTRQGTKKKEKGLCRPKNSAHKIIDAFSEKQAEDILLLDIRSVASFADYFVIASAWHHRTRWTPSSTPSSGP
jgi:hypothetical protein